MKDRAGEWWREEYIKVEIAKKKEIELERGSENKERLRV